MAFILENVDSMDNADDDAGSNNVQVAIGILNEIGYHTVVEKLNSADYGVPQRRSRIYFVGLRDSGVLAEPKEAMLAKLHDRLMHMMTPVKDMLHLDAILYDDDRHLLAEELGRRQRQSEIAANKKDKPSEDDAAQSSETTAVKPSDKWLNLHSAMAEQYGVMWPLVPPDHLRDNQWFKTLTAREQEVVPTILPGSKLWSTERGRLLIGSEMLLLQGYPIHDLEFVMNLTEHQQADLAGNSFTVPVITSVILALVSTLRWQTQSEDEELNMIPFPKLNGTRNW